MRVFSLILISNTNESHSGSFTAVVGDTVLARFNFEMYDMNGINCFVQRVHDLVNDVKEGTLIQCLLECSDTHAQCTYNALVTQDTAIMLRPQSECNGVYAFAVMRELSDAPMLQLCERMLAKDLVIQSTRTFKPVTIEDERLSTDANSYGTFVQPPNSGDTGIRDGAVPPQQQRVNSANPQPSPSNSQPILMPVPSSRVPAETTSLDEPTTCSDLSIRVDLNEFKQQVMTQMDDQVARIYEMELRMAEMNKKLDAILGLQRRNPSSRGINGDIASEITQA